MVTRIRSSMHAIQVLCNARANDFPGMLPRYERCLMKECNGQDNSQNLHAPSTPNPCVTVSFLSLGMRCGA
eukprot:265096-Amphidinium_carterae.1